MQCIAKPNKSTPNNNTKNLVDCHKRHHPNISLQTSVVHWLTQVNRKINVNMEIFTAEKTGIYRILALAPAGPPSSKSGQTDPALAKFLTRFGRRQHSCREHQLF